MQYVTCNTRIFLVLRVTCFVLYDLLYNIAMLKIVTTPNPILNKAVKPVKYFDNKLVNLVQEMSKTLIAQKDPEGVGLAAPQVGHDLAFFIIRPVKKAEIEVFVNPQIIKQVTSNKKSKKPASATHPSGGASAGKVKKIKLEGCLSIPRIWGAVKRADKLLLKYQDINGNTKQRWFSSLKAVIIQHEIDHLNGVLFTQRVLEQKKELFEEKDGQLKKIPTI